MSYAIIDFGTNALRVVVYEDNTIAARELYNARFKTDIKLLLEQGNVSSDHPLYDIIESLTYLFQKYQVVSVHCVATAAFRQGVYAKELCAFIKEKYGLSIKIVSGAEEARFAAQGLLLGLELTNGLMIDFGGGSLELAKIDQRNIEEVASLPFGINILKEDPERNHALLNEEIQKVFPGYFCRNLYLVGGSFRNFIRRFFGDTYSALKILHNFALWVRFLRQNYNSPF